MHNRYLAMDEICILPVNELKTWNNINASTWEAATSNSFELSNTSIHYPHYVAM